MQSGDRAGQSEQGRGGGRLNHRWSNGTAEERGCSLLRPEREDVVAAIARGPSSAFVHWALNGPRSAEATRRLGPAAKWALRVVNLSGGTGQTTPVDPRAGRHYVEVEAGQTYGFELAVRAGRKWRTICRSGRVEMPPAEPAPLKTGSPRGMAGLDFESTVLGLGSSRLSRTKR